MYKVGRKYYLPVEVCVDKCDGSNFPIVIEFDDGENKIYNSVKDKPGILLPAEDIPTVIDAENYNELLRTLKTYEKRIDDYMAERRRDKMNIRLLLDKIAELEKNNG
jgi:hypothetical protein